MNNIDFRDRIYLDESGINQFLHRNYGRSARGERVQGEISGKRFARESIIAALSQGKFLAPMCYQGTCNTELFNTWLEKVLVPELRPGQVLILDNASFHRSKTSKQLVEDAGCKYNLHEDHEGKKRHEDFLQPSVYKPFDAILDKICAKID